MTTQWRDDLPIYRQLQERICSLIIQGDYPEGSALPSVRQLSSDLGINHLTVAKAYQELVTNNLVEKRRGLGMFVSEGAHEALKTEAIERFLNEELPSFAKHITQLNIPLDEVFARLTTAHEEAYESEKDQEQ